MESSRDSSFGLCYPKFKDKGKHQGQDQCEQQDHHGGIQEDIDRIKVQR